MCRLAELSCFCPKGRQAGVGYRLLLLLLQNGGINIIDTECAHMIGNVYSATKHRSLLGQSVLYRTLDVWLSAARFTPGSGE